MQKTNCVTIRFRQGIFLDSNIYNTLPLAKESRIYMVFSALSCLWILSLEMKKKVQNQCFADRLDFQPVLCVSMIHAIIHEKNMFSKLYESLPFLHTTKIGKTYKVEFFCC